MAEGLEDRQGWDSLKSTFFYLEFQIAPQTVGTDERVGEKKKQPTVYLEVTTNKRSPGN